MSDSVADKELRLMGAKRILQIVEWAKEFNQEESLQVALDEYEEEIRGRVEEMEREKDVSFNPHLIQQ